MGHDESCRPENRQHDVHARDPFTGIFPCDRFVDDPNRQAFTQPIMQTREVVRAMNKDNGMSIASCRQGGEVGHRQNPTGRCTG